jgi:hypothetical protein
MLLKNSGTAYNNKIQIPPFYLNFIIKSTEDIRILRISSFFNSACFYDFMLIYDNFCTVHSLNHGDSDLLAFLSYLLRFLRYKLNTYLFLTVCDNSVVTYLET